MKKLIQLLVDVYDNRSPNFSGLGLIFYHDFNQLPISPLRRVDPNFPLTDYDKIVSTLIDYSDANSDFHDGFHLISQDFKLTHVSQYFSPNIITDAPIEYQFGGRFRAAMYGSYHAEISACGVVSKNYPPTVFIKGKKYQ